MATIKKYTKKDGSTAYQFNVYLGIDPLTGKKKRTTRRGFKTQKEAKLALARLQLETSTQGFTKQVTTTFRDAYDLWYSQYVNTVKPTTKRNVESMFRIHILPLLGDIRINKLTKQICQNAVNEWAKTYSAYSQLKAITSKMLRYAISNDIIDNNPMEYVILPKKHITSKEDTYNFLELSELKHMLALAKEKLNYKGYMVLRTLAFTGLRKGELYALNWSDLNFIEKTLSVNKNVSLNTITTTKTKKSTRIIGIDDTTLAELKKWKTFQKKELFSLGYRVKTDKEQLIFSSDENTLLYNEYVNGILNRRLKMNISPHSLRHTHASIFFESGATIKEVQERLGHADMNTTMNIYTHVTKKTQSATMKKINSFSNF